MNAVVTDPVTMVYHELRSPLGLMVTAARSAAYESSDEYVRARCESIVRAAERMLRTATRIIDIASASQSAEETDFSPRDVVEEVVEDYRQLGVVVVLDTSGGASLTHGARQHLEALMCSLLGNAMDHGDPAMPILVCVETERDQCTVTIRNAIGSERSHSGLGLGSHIGQQLARQLGASLSTSISSTEYAATIELPLLTLVG